MTTARNTCRLATSTIAATVLGVLVGWPAAAETRPAALVAPHEGGGSQLGIVISLFGHPVQNTSFPVKAGAPLDVGVTITDLGEASLRSVRVTIGPDAPGGDPGTAAPRSTVLGATTCTTGTNGAISLEPGQTTSCHGRILASSGDAVVPVSVNYRIPGELQPRSRRRDVPYVGVDPAVTLRTTVDGSVPQPDLSFAKGTPITRVFTVTNSGDSPLSDLRLADPGLPTGSITCTLAPGTTAAARSVIKTLPAAGTTVCTGTAPALDGTPLDCPTVVGVPAQQVLTATGFQSLPKVSASDPCFLVDPPDMPDAPVAFLPPPITREGAGTAADANRTVPVRTAADAGSPPSGPGGSSRPGGSTTAGDACGSTSSGSACGSGSTSGACGSGSTSGPGGSGGACGSGGTNGTCGSSGANSSGGACGSTDPGGTCNSTSATTGNGGSTPAGAGSRCLGQHRLARTGANIGLLLLLTAGIIAAGLATVFAARRRSAEW